MVHSFFIACQIGTHCLLELYLSIGKGDEVNCMCHYPYNTPLDDVTMNFLLGIPQTIMKQLSKIEEFIPCNRILIPLNSQLAKLFVRKVIKLHGR